MRLRILGFLLLVAIVAGARPAAAQTAICRDSTRSYSRDRSDVCSGHGGVASWTSKPPTTPQSSSTGRSANRAPNPTRRTAQPTRRSAQSTRRTSARRSSASSRVYHTGPRGGCYYYSASGRKNYVDRSLCR